MRLHTKELATCIIPNPQGKLLLVHRKKPQQWEFPGAEIDKGEDLQSAALRAVVEDLNLAVEISDTLTTSRFSRHGNLYIVHRFVTQAVGVAIPEVRNLRTYDAADYRDISRKGAAAVGFSPAVESLVHDVVNGKYDFRQQDI